jgi:hypothetical protein
MADIVKLKDRVDIVKEDLVQNKIDVRRTTILGRRYTASDCLITLSSSMIFAINLP